MAKNAHRMHMWLNNVMHKTERRGKASTIFHEHQLKCVTSILFFARCTRELGNSANAMNGRGLNMKITWKNVKISVRCQWRSGTQHLLTVCGLTFEWTSINWLVFISVFQKWTFTRYPRLILCHGCMAIGWLHKNWLWMNGMMLSGNIILSCGNELVPIKNS